ECSLGAEPGDIAGEHVDLDVGEHGLLDTVGELGDGQTGVVVGGHTHEVSSTCTCDTTHRIIGGGMAHGHRVYRDVAAFDGAGDPAAEHVSVELAECCATVGQEHDRGGPVHLFGGCRGFLDEARDV